MSDEPGDDELRLHLQVLRCQAGDERAFAALYARFAARTLRYLRGLLGGEDAAEDVQQEVWLAVYRGVAALSDPRAFRTWLYRTTRHRAVDFLRRRRRERELAADVAAETPLASDPDDADPFAPLEPLDATALHAALTTLPPAQREVLVLRYQDGLGYAEIALVVGCPVGTVRSRLHHAKRQLQDRIESARRDQP